MNMTEETINVATNTKTKTPGKVKLCIKQMTFISLMGAVSGVLMLFQFHLPLLPPFMSFDFSAIPEMIGGFMFGPVSAFYIIIVKLLVHFVTQGSTSIGTGELQNLILGCAYVMPAILIYNTKKSKKRALIGMIVGTITVSIVSIFSNLYLIIPFYAKLSGSTMADFVAMCSAVNPAVKDSVSMVLLGILPFNIIKYGVSSAVTFILYKHLSRPIRSFINR